MALVDHPEDVFVKESQEADAIILELSVNKDDMGKVIGRQGRIAKAIRTVMRATANRKDMKIQVEID